MVLFRPYSDTELSSLALMMTREGLAECGGDPAVFLKKLGEKGRRYGVRVKDKEAVGKRERDKGREGRAKEGRMKGWKLWSKW
jgi:hypothetical protein